MDSAATITRPATGEASPGSSRVTGAAAGAKRTENATRATSKPLKPIAAHAKVIISRRAASRLREGHVWVYRSEIISESATQPGALVHIEDERGKFLGTALYSSSSQIALRKLTAERLQNQQQLLELLLQRVRTALAYRQWLLQAKDTNAARFRDAALSGQRTGPCLDQREIYAAAEKYAHGKALDAFCYQGGFALHLSRTCTEVTALDPSRPALEVAEENEKLNHIQGQPEIEWIEANAFDLLKDYSSSGKQSDTIFLDPPAFAKSKRNLETALRGYKELNLRAVKMLRPGGVLVTCSCSYHVSEQYFRQMLTPATVDAGRTLCLLEMRAQSKDHPIVLGIPETHYLKCLICTLR